MMSYPYLSLATVNAAAKAASERGVSAVARSSRGFVTAYRKAKSSKYLSDAWKAKRDGFVARHMAQVRKNREKLWDKEGRPTRRHLALVMWAYSPDAAKLGGWVRRHVKRKNPDPLSILASGSAIAYDLAVSRDLERLQDRRKNPDWSNIISEGVGTGIGVTIGAALARPVADAFRKNPATSEKQRRLFALALAVKRREIGRKTVGPDVLRIADTMSEAQIRDFFTVRGKARKARKNPTLLLASNPVGGRKRKRKAGPERKYSARHTAEDPQDHYGNPDFERAREQYRRFFYGDEPMEVIPIEAPEGTPKYLVALGQAPEVTYQPPNHTSKRGVPFVHEFGEEGGEPPYLVTDASGEWLGYIGGTWAITPDGIRN